MDSLNKSFVIFIDGLTLADCNNIDDQFDRQLLERFDTANRVVKNTYDKIQPIFTTLETWPKSNNILCWNCDGISDSMPVFVPTHVKILSETSLEMSTLGSFCWFNCASAYINSSIPVHKKTEYFKNLLYLYKIMTGRTITNILPSDLRYVMHKYGGPKSQIEYYESIQKLKESHMLDIDSEYVFNKDSFSNIRPTIMRTHQLEANRPPICHQNRKDLEEYHDWDSSEDMCITEHG